MMPLLLICLAAGRAPASILFPYTTLFRSWYRAALRGGGGRDSRAGGARDPGRVRRVRLPADHGRGRSEEHTSELQSRPHLVCRLLLEKNNWPNTAPPL